MKQIDCLFINPRDLIGADAYIKLANLAGVLRTNGLTSEIIEPAATNVSHSQILDVIKTRSPKVICIGIFPSTLHDAYVTVNLIREQFPEIPIVAEGYHVNAVPEIVQQLNIPYGIRGDADYAFLELCQSILQQRLPPKDLPGLITYKDEELSVNEPAFIRDIDSLPMPAFDLLPIGSYYSASTNKVYMKFFTTRGCPYDCNFCASAPQMNYRYLSTQNVIQQLTVLVTQLGVQWVEFMDLTFTVSKKRTQEICDAIIQSGLQFDWGCETRADKIDEELVVKMKAAGCKKITFGVESGSEKIRYQTGKRIDNNTFKKAFALCRKHGLKTMANFILGHPGETAHDMQASIKFARELKPFNVLFLRMIPLPDVEVYTQGVKNGEVDPDVWIKYMKGEIGHPVYYPRSVSPSEMDKLYKKAYLHFYLSPLAIKNYLPFLFDFAFMRKSLSIFLRMTFGKPVFK
jgi:radical SAM superfamily enzyme YgiQ (UPF0313 family)